MWSMSASHLVAASACRIKWHAQYIFIAENVNTGHKYAIKSFQFNAAYCFSQTANQKSFRNNDDAELWHYRQRIARRQKFDIGLKIAGWWAATDKWPFWWYLHLARRRLWYWLSPEQNQPLKLYCYRTTAVLGVKSTGSLSWRVN